MRTATVGERGIRRAVEGRVVAVERGIYAAGARAAHVVHGVVGWVVGVLERRSVIAGVKAPAAVART